MDAIARLKGTLVAFTLTAAACLLGADAALGGTLDQQQTNIGGTGYAMQAMQSIAQTFTAGASGGIDQVDLALYRSSTAPTVPLNIQIRDVVGGTPGGAVLASQTLGAAALTTSPAFTSISFPQPAPVTAGTQYAIVTFTASVIPAFYAWAGSTTPDPYPAGSSFYTTNSPPSGAWTAITTPTEDFGFKTYVAPPVPPTPMPTTATGQRAAALAKCKHKHSKRKRRKCRRRANRLPV